MSEVFISYARSTEALAEQLTDALHALGHDVWRDDLVPVHRAYGEVIEERLHQAKAVVVIWSADALQSVWVRSEADRARMLSKLVQLTVDGSRLPMPFDQIQCADLADWTGDLNHRGFRKVAASIAQLVGASDPPVSATAAPAPLERLFDAPAPEAATPRDVAATIAEPPQAEAPPEAPAASAEAPQVASPPDVLAAAEEARTVDAPPEVPAAVAAAPNVATPPEARATTAEALRAGPLPEVAATATRAPPSGAPTKRSGPPAALVALGAVVAVAAIGGGVWLATAGLAPHRAAPAASATPAAAASAGPAPLNPAYQQIAQAAAALADDAQGQGRPAGEAADLTQLATRIDGLLAQLQAASARPANASQVAGLTAQLNQATAEGAQAEAATLSHAGETLVGEAESTLGGAGAPSGAAPALAALRGSKQALDAADASVGGAADAAGSLAAARAALAAWGQVRTDYTAATAFYAPALRARFHAAEDAARAAAARVIAAANTPKPWFFPSKSQKQAYQALQDHAAEAKRDLAALDRLQGVAAGGDLRQLRGAAAQAGEIRDSLGALAAAPR